MAHNPQMTLIGIAMEDELGITYLVENAQQFWSELEDTLNIGKDIVPTLFQLDSTLRRFLALSAAYHEQYLQSPLQLQHACELLLDSELFEFHNERMCEILVDDLQSNTDPHAQFIFYHVLLCYGRRRDNFFRSQKRWQPLLPLIIDHILVDIDPEVEDTYFGVVGGSGGALSNVPVPIEAKLRGLGVMLLYEVCRVQKLSVRDLQIFDDAFIDYLLDLVEQTRQMQDETFNYGIIKLIVALNEQFMVASLSAGLEPRTNEPESKNWVVRVLVRRLGSSRTFGENMIFMLNRAGRTPEDLCMQLLILKILYVLFTTHGASEYFYTNDLYILVDVFLRELIDLDEESESLRHTYLRVLDPLLTKTQLRDIPYKRPQIVFTLESLIGNSRVRDVNPTTKRLVERCLSRDWCVRFKAQRATDIDDDGTRAVSPISDFNTAARSPTQFTHAPASQQLSRTNSKTLKTSKSAENLRASRDRNQENHTRQPWSPLDKLQRPNNNASAINLAETVNGRIRVHGSANAHVLPKRRGTTNSVEVEGQQQHLTRHAAHSNIETGFPQHDRQLIPLTSNLAVATSTSKSVPQQQQQQSRRSAPPPPPPKRRNPPAVPGNVERTHGGATITAIKSSAVPPLMKAAKA